MASFFEQQAQARKITGRLLVLFALAVVSIVAVVTLAVHVIIEAKTYRRSSRAGIDGFVVRQERSYAPEIAVASFTLLTIGIGSAIRIAQIGGNGTNLALMLGGIPVSPATTDPLEKRLVNVVEEMAIASSVPVPKIFVLPNEAGINAFAAGTTPSQAVVAVTRGTLETLTRDELQGVVAHEFSHIFNGDMKLNLQLIGVLGGILAIATIGQMMMRARGKDSGGVVAAGLGLFVLGYLGVFFGRLIKAAVSRQREFLADSSAVQYTRNPLGIGGALMKIREGYSQVSNHYAEEASHMFFGTAKNFSSMFATHPPLEERITRISPVLLKQGGWTSRDAQDTRAEEIHADRDELISNFQSSSVPKPAPRSIQSVVAAVGAPDARDLSAAQDLIRTLPAQLREDLRHADYAREMIAALLLEPGGGSQKQHAQIRASLGDEGLQKTKELLKDLGDRGRDYRLSILQLSLPAFRNLSVEQQRAFIVLARELVFADDKFELFEFVALTIIETQMSVKPQHSGDKKPTTGDISIVLSALAYAGTENEDAAKAAFAQGLVAFDSKIQGSLSLCAPYMCKFEALTPAVWRLARALPQTKGSLVEACTRVILSDKVVTRDEDELLHAVCAVIEAPLPVMATA